MAFCIKCGKEIAEGELCESCQSVQNEPAGEKAKTNVDVKGEATNIIGNVADIVGDPEGGVERFVSGITWAKVAVLSAIYALIDVLFGIWNKISANIDYKKSLKEQADDLDMDLDEYLDWIDLDLAKIYKTGNIVKGVFMDILYAAAAIAVTAVVFYFAIKLIKKTKATWQTVFAISIIDLLVIVPVMVVNQLLGLIPDFKLLTWIMGAISTISSVGAIVLTYLAAKKECGDTKSTVYVVMSSYVVSGFAISFVNFLIVSLFS